MQIIQPHYHGIARTAQDYERMAMSGVVAVAEPAFWAGFDRRYPETFIDYFRQISEFEPTRAAQYGIRHFCWVAVNPKEAENPALSREVMRHMPEFFRKAHGAGRGRDRLAQDDQERSGDLRGPGGDGHQHDQLLLIHTPHLADKLHGTKRTLEILRTAGRPAAGLDRSRRGAHDPRTAGRRLLGRLHALSDHQVLAQTGGRHAGEVRLRSGCW